MLKANPATPPHAYCPVHDGIPDIARERLAQQTIRQENVPTLLDTAETVLRQSDDRQPLRDTLTQIGNSPDPAEVANLLVQCENAEPGLGRQILALAEPTTTRRKAAYQIQSGREQHEPDFNSRPDLRTERRRIIRQWLTFYGLGTLTLAAFISLTWVKRLLIPDDHWAYMPATIILTLAMSVPSFLLGRTLVRALPPLLFPNTCRCRQTAHPNGTTSE